MRHQGRIDTWQDDRGFGFITPDAGGQRVFVHIKSFTRPDQILASVIAASALSGVGIAAVLGLLPMWVAFLYAGASLFSFLAYAVDKSAALRGRWRVSERMLQVLALAGGWPGALVAQRWLRHKTRKTSFQVTFWGVVVVNCGALVWFYLGLPVAWTG